MPSTLQETSRLIVKNSIRSAICIDDRYLSFEKIDSPEAKGLITDEPRDLYLSFRKDGHCDLDIYTFEGYEKFKKDEYLLKNKDLLVLDWELDNEKSSLAILEEVVEAQEIPFVVIYTATEDLHLVGKTLAGHFSSYERNYYDSFYETQEFIAEHFLQHQSELISLFYEDFYFGHIRKEPRKRIFKLMSESLPGINADWSDERIFSKLKGFMNPGTYVVLPETFSELQRIFLSSDSEKEFSFDLERVFAGEHLYMCNGVNIAVFHKRRSSGGILPEDLFQKFSESLIASPNNFLSLLSIELKDALRQEFSKIGVKFSAIDEMAFFFHLNNYRIPAKSGDYDLDSGYDFILKGWLHEMFQLQMGKLPSILNHAQEYYTQNVESKIPGSPKSSQDFINSLAKYSALVSNVNLGHRINKKIRFGDLFMASENQFFLCITPSCDCLRPKKIKNNFIFIEGAICENKIALKYSESDDKHVSFITDLNGEPISIEWTTKPFTFFVKETSNNIDELKVSFQGKRKHIELKPLTILKENYAQRIANASYGYGFRVGIDLPHI